MLGSGMNFITTVIGFAMSATFIVFICARLICGKLRRIESRQMFEIDSRIDLEQPEHRITGLEPIIVAAIPTIKFDREAFSSMDDAQCTICLGEYQEKEVLRIMPKCGHTFHLTCIDVWLRKQSTCPVCRLSVHSASVSRSFNNPEALPEDFGQWPAALRSEGNIGIYQGRPESGSRFNLEPVQSELAQARL